MDRKIMENNKAFTLVELIVAMVVIAIMATIAIPAYRTWIKKRDVENDIKIAHIFIQEARAKAFTEKRSYVIGFNSGTNTGKVLEQRTGGNVVKSINLKYNLKFKSGTTINIDTRGTFSGSSIYTIEYLEDPEYTCVSISDLRARLGKWDAVGGKCDAK